MLFRFQLVGPTVKFDNLSVRISINQSKPTIKPSRGVLFTRGHPRSDLRTFIIFHASANHMKTLTANRQSVARSADVGDHALIIAIGDTM